MLLPRLKGLIVASISLFLHSGLDNIIMLGIAIRFVVFLNLITFFFTHFVSLHFLLVLTTIAPHVIVLFVLFSASLFVFMLVYCLLIFILVQASLDSPIFHPMILSGHRDRPP